MPQGKIKPENTRVMVVLSRDVKAKAEKNCMYRWANLIWVDSKSRNKRS